MSTITTENYSDLVSQRVSAESHTLTARWLVRLNELLTVKPNEVFPSQELLDHVPTLIGEIAGYLRAPAEEEIAANAAVIAKARELGVLRHRQQASVHQLLREYETLGELLEAFVVDETTRLALQPTSAECFEVLRRLTRATRMLMRTTIDTFVSEYTAAIQERDERINSFHLMTSHELRSPIGTLLFAAAMLDKDGVRSDPRRLTKIASTISTNALRLSRLVTNLERLSKLTESVDVPSQQRVELHAIASEVVRQLDEMAVSRGVDIRVEEKLPTIVGDPARLELVMLNLVSNAIKYCDPQKTERRIEIVAIDDPDTTNGTCAIAVRDNGLGIPDSGQAAIFDRFFRAHPDLDGQLGVTGSGLGLAIVADCVGELGGTIRCESQVGQGTTFKIVLPCDPSSSSGPTATDENHAD